MTGHHSFRWWIVLVVVLAAAAFLSARPAERVDLAGPAAVSGPSRSVTYRISGTDDGPGVTEATIDPIDPRVGEEQSFTVLAGDRARAVTVTVITDGGERSRDLMLDEVSSRWTGSWRTDDMHGDRYQIRIDAGDGAATSSATLTLPRSTR